jgi:hypothetical protein
LRRPTWKDFDMKGGKIDLNSRLKGYIRSIFLWLTLLSITCVVFVRL